MPLSADRLPLELPPVQDLELNGYALRLSQYLSRDYYGDLATASVELPAIIEWLSQQLQGIVEQKIKAEANIKRFEAKAWFYLQQGGWEERQLPGKRNNLSLTHAVRLDPSVTEAQDHYAVLVGWQLRLENIVRSLQAKLDLVRSIEATRRHLDS